MLRPDGCGIAMQRCLGGFLLAFVYLQGYRQHLFQICNVEWISPGYGRLSHIVVADRGDIIEESFIHLMSY